jgi:hypothetical protein
MKDLDFLSSLLYRTLAETMNLSIRSHHYLPVPGGEVQARGHFDQKIRLKTFEARLGRQIQRDRDVDVVLKKYPNLCELPNRFTPDDKETIRATGGGSEKLCITESGYFEFSGYTSVSKVIAATSELEHIFKQYKKYDE